MNSEPDFFTGYTTATATSAPKFDADSILKTMHHLVAIAPKPVGRKTLVCHPDNVEVLRKNSITGEGLGMRVAPSLACNKYTKEWQFPADRFIEYEESDKKWAIPLGFGKWVETTNLAFYVINEPRMEGWIDAT